MKEPHLLAILLLQLAVIILLARVCGLIAARLKQPQVVGEIVAGIVLGPTFLGWVWPWGMQNLFPSEMSMKVLQVVAQLGVILFLFLIGLEFDHRVLKRRGRSAAAISISGIMVPFVIGFLATYPLIHLFDPQHAANPFPTALFMGAAMSVTAFPVLARIVAERNLQKTDEGAMAIAAAAVDDVLAWTMLAIVIAFVPGQNGNTSPVTKLLMAGVYVGVMLLLVRPFLVRVGRLFERQGGAGSVVTMIVLVTLLLSCFATEMIGIHALFGAFVAGFVMPKQDRFVSTITEKLESVSIILLLPAFFAYAGLKVDLRHMFAWDMVGYTVLLIVLACAGKLGGCMLSAKLTGMPWRASFTLGVLMNTRGLMELIILTVGLELGVINAQVFSMMVIMALVTTGMAAPLLQLLLPAREGKRQADRIFSVLIPVAKPESGGPLLEMAFYLTDPEGKSSRITALHLDRLSTDLTRGIGGNISPPDAEKFFTPLLTQAESRNISVGTLSYFSRDIASDIARISRTINADLVLIGHHAPVFGSALLGGVVHRVMTGTDCDVGVFIDRNFRRPQRILVPFLNSVHDRLALELAGRIAKSTGARITIIHISSQPAASTELRVFKDPSLAEAVHIKVVPKESPISAILKEARNHDLMVIGVAEEWGLESSLLGLRAERIASECPISLLIVRRYQGSEPVQSSV
ncbi:MAG: sodium:proton antiporter [Phycisphaerae bacterium]|nr:MAG: sodium:proton antiporter [Phycisphaerae bacterium]